jgi:hypothetical protein
MLYDCVYTRPEYNSILLQYTYLLDIIQVFLQVTEIFSCL